MDIAQFSGVPLHCLTERHGLNSMRGHDGRLIEMFDREQQNGNSSAGVSDGGHTEGEVDALKRKVSRIEEVLVDKRYIRPLDILGHLADVLDQCDL